MVWLIEDDRMMAACGLLCGPCHICKMPFDEESAHVTLKWYCQMGWLSEDEDIDVAIERKMCCTGCHGDRGTHWSSNCWILKCCVDEKSLHHCHECSDFPCSRLCEWSEQSDEYKQAFERLSGLETDS